MFSTNERTNVLRRFRNRQSREFVKLTAHQFMETWHHYDTNSNSYIDEKEVDNFLRDLVSSVTELEAGDEAISNTAFKELKKTFLEAYDSNKDGKIELRELTQILPGDEQFLLFFREETKLNSSTQFMKVWIEFDEDSNGFIEQHELNKFLHYLLRKHGYNEVSESKFQEYCEIMLEIFDFNKDGKLDLQEMIRLLPIKENFMANNGFKKPGKLSKEDINRTFQFCDNGNKNYLTRAELGSFFRELHEITNQTFTGKDIQEIYDTFINISPIKDIIDKKTLMSIIMSYNNHI
uniref:Calcium binding protein n=1 Tax=Dicyema japonicum TaxID=399803 RepID=B9ZYV8_DICJA|nr:calcium binding protein [Dicyema japonicum]